MNDDRIITVVKTKDYLKVFCNVWFMDEVKGQYKRVSNVALTKTEAQTLHKLLSEVLEKCTVKSIEDLLIPKNGKI